MAERRYRYYTSDVFTDRQFGGNPLAVFPDGDGLSSAEMQSIANEFNLSETVFVLPPENPAHARRLRIFTPAAELPFAGHPTVGTAVVLAAIGEIECAHAETVITLEEGVGPIEVVIRKPGYARFSVAKLPEFGPPPPSPNEIAAALGIAEADLESQDNATRAASCGVPFLCVAIKQLETVRNLRIDPAACGAMLEHYWTQQLYVYTREAATQRGDIHARMFAPELGVQEDPATGSAAAVLAGVLAAGEGSHTGTLSWVIEQGFEIDRPSFIEIEAVLENGEVSAVRVGGEAVLMSEGELILRA